MTIADLICRAADAGVTLTLSTAGLELNAQGQPPALLLAELIVHKIEIIAALSAVSAPLPASAWLWLLVKDDGTVIQCGITGKERPAFNITNVCTLAVPGFNRRLSEQEVAMALAGTLEAPTPPPIPSCTWLSHVARLLGVLPAVLLEEKHLGPHGLIEWAGTDPERVADSIRHSSAWINRSFSDPPQ
jgi:hypothetical protein